MLFRSASSGGIIRHPGSRPAWPEKERGDSSPGTGGEKGRSLPGGGPEREKGSGLSSPAKWPDGGSLAASPYKPGKSRGPAWPELETAHVGLSRGAKRPEGNKPDRAEAIDTQISGADALCGKPMRPEDQAREEAGL